jgi:hypothetical protein
LQGSKGDVELYVARKDPLPLDPALLAAVAFDSMVLGKLLVPLLLFFMICDTTVIEPWLCYVPAIKPMTLCVHLVVILSHGCAVLWPSSR